MTTKNFFMNYTILLILISIHQIASGQSGSLDPNFGDGGKKIIFSSAGCFTVAAQYNGNILSGGAGVHEDTGHVII